jgi:hypothetical protein
MTDIERRALAVRGCTYANRFDWKCSICGAGVDDNGDTLIHYDDTFARYLLQKCSECFTMADWSTICDDYKLSEARWQINMGYPHSFAALWPKDRLKK